MIIRSKKGFTLIELLVVIAIIGILASIVVVSVISSRNKARDASITASVSQIRNIAELSRESNGNFSNICNDPAITGLITSGISENGGALVCNDNADEYCASSVLNSGAAVCVDDLATLKSGNCGVGTSCP